MITYHCNWDKHSDVDWQIDHEIMHPFLFLLILPFTDTSQCITTVLFKIVHRWWCGYGIVFSMCKQDKISKLYWNFVFACWLKLNELYSYWLSRLKGNFAHDLVSVFFCCAEREIFILYGNDEKNFSWC